LFFYSVVNLNCYSVIASAAKQSRIIKSPPSRRARINPEDFGKNPYPFSKGGISYV